MELQYSGEKLPQRVGLPSWSLRQKPWRIRWSVIAATTSRTGFFSSSVLASDKNQ
jgi:hypothetical protein